MNNNFKNMLYDFLDLDPKWDYDKIGLTKGQFRNLEYVMYELCKQGYSGTISSSVVEHCEKYKQKIIPHDIGWKIYRSDTDEQNNATYLKLFGKRRLRETEKSRLINQIIFGEKTDDDCDE